MSKRAREAIARKGGIVPRGAVSIVGEHPETIVPLNAIRGRGFRLGPDVLEGLELNPGQLESQLANELALPGPDRELSDDAVIGRSIRATVGVSVRAVDENARTVRFVASTEDVARDGDIVRADGWVLEQLERNPVFLWAHSYGTPPIGRIVETELFTGKAEKNPRLEIVVQFAGYAEAYDFAETVFRLYAHGFMHAVSVGFLIRAYENPDADEKKKLGLEQWGIVITSAELLEVSAVPVPADAGALITSSLSGIARGIISRGDLERLAENVDGPTRESVDAVLRITYRTDELEARVDALEQRIDELTPSPTGDETPAPEAPERPSARETVSSVLRSRGIDVQLDSSADHARSEGLEPDDPYGLASGIRGLFTEPSPEV